MITKPRTFRTRKDGWLTLSELLVGTPEEFNPDGATIRGRARVEGYGWMPEREASELRAVEDRVEFVIYSYETPIAWKIDGGWVIPEVTYSVTTGRHQGLVRTAVGQILVWQDAARGGQ